jgi:hypothetical protein
MISIMLYMQRCQRQDLGPLSIPQLSSNHTRQSGTDRIAVLVDEDAGIVVEFDETAVFSLLFLSCSHNDCVSDIPSPYFVLDADRTSLAFTKAPLLLHHNDYTIA